MNFRLCPGGMLLAALLLSAGPAPAQEAPKPAVKIQRTVQKTYNETANPRTQIDSALKIAAEDGIRVLINWGSNDDARCAAFMLVLRSPELAEARFLADEYRHVAVDVGKGDRNQEIARAYGVNVDPSALPYFTILDGSGKVLAQAAGRDLCLDGDSAKFDPKKVAGLLSKYKTSAPDAKPLFDAAMLEAGRADKYMLLWFSAPW